MTIGYIGSKDCKRCKHFNEEISFCTKSNISLSRFENTILYCFEGDNLTKAMALTENHLRKSFLILDNIKEKVLWYLTDVRCAVENAIGLDFWEIKEGLCDGWTDLCIKGIEITNRYKDRCLAHRLHQVADHYDPRPTGEWE